MFHLKTNLFSFIPRKTETLSIDVVADGPVVAVASLLAPYVVGARWTRVGTHGSLSTIYWLKWKTTNFVNVEPGTKCEM